MNVLVLPRHGLRAASCRHRFMQYVPYLEAQGMTCEVSPFFDDQYTEALLTGGDKHWWRFAGSAWRRWQAVRSRRFDLVVVHAEFIPFAPLVFERRLARQATPFVIDFDDAFFHAYGTHPSAVVRTLFGGKLDALMKDAALNIAGSRYLADYARTVTNRVAMVPTVVDLERFPKAFTPPAASRFTIGWIGSPATTVHLQSVADELRAFARGRDVEVVAIGARPFDAGDLPIRFIEWSEESQVQELTRCHVGIMPLPDTAFARGKCGFKLIQTMACWRPVVASPVGANCQIVEHGVSGMHAKPGEWGVMLQRLLDDPAMATRLSLAARAVVEREYSLQTWAPRLADCWRRAAH